MEGLIVFTNDKDFKRFREMVPQGFRTQARRLFGRINLQVEPAHAVKCINDVIDLIEAHHANAARRGIRLQLQITATIVTVIDNARPP